jgi:hypothetical protein
VAAVTGPMMTKAARWVAWAEPALPRKRPRSRTDAIEPQDTWLDFDQLQLGGPEDQVFRGKLKRRSDGESHSKIQQAVRTLEKLHAPGGLVDPRSLAATSITATMPRAWSRFPPMVACTACRC